MSITKISPSVVDFDDGITITVDDNSAALTLKSTDTDASIGPILDLSRDNSSAADGDVTGTIRFVSDDDANNQTTYVQLVSKIVDASNSTEDGSFHIESVVAGSTTQRMDVLAGETVFNEGSADLDFRVESNDTANRLFIDAGNDKMLIGTTASRNVSGIVPALFQEAVGYTGASYGLVANSNDSNGAYILIGKSRGTSLGSSTALNNGDQIGGIYFQAADGTDIQHAAAYITANIYGDVGTNDVPGMLRFFTTPDGSATPTEKLRIPPSGGITFNGDTSTANALDDYEEGTWTPTLYGYNGNTVSVSGTFNGFYTKIGRLVNIILYAEDMTFSSGVSSNYIQISLPFAAHGGSTMLTNAYGAGSFTSTLMDFAHEHAKPSFITTTTIGFLGSNQDGGAWNWETWATMSAGAYWRISMTYMTAT